MQLRIPMASSPSLKYYSLFLHSSVNSRNVLCLIRPGNRIHVLVQARGLFRTSQGFVDMVLTC